MSAHARPMANARSAPLVVDLDGTLIRTDLLHESVIQLVKLKPHMALALPVWLASGKAAMKRQVAQRVPLDVRELPYNQPLLEWIRAEKTGGRTVVLCTASDQRYAQAVAEHLGLFDEVIASDGVINVSAEHKARLLVERFGEQGFDYAGNSHDDLVVWRHARQAIVVNASASVCTLARAQGRVEREFARETTGLRTWLRAMRIHQWLKNLLVLLPLAGSFQFDNLLLLRQSLLAFLAFGLCASSVYILNDLMDLESDRSHSRKRLRPFAAGLLSPLAGIGFAALLLALSVTLAWSVRPAFLGWLGLYFSLTLAYSVFLKRRVLIDCITLGGLYTLRIVAGGAAVGLQPSFWLLAFSLFLFLSLAFLKRFSELSLVAREGREDAPGRGYLASDVALVQALGTAAGFSAVMLLALYINGDTVLKLYSRPEVVWLTIPILLYWISRMWMQAQRGHMHDDPVVFALRDRYSLACGLLFGATMWAAR